MSSAVHHEQAVYGSFPFWDKGYALLARSPGCRAEWLEAFCVACQRFGERPSGSPAFSGAMFSLRLPGDGPWAIVGVSTPGADDRGRPDAMAFHGLFVEDREFRKIGHDPFLLVPALRSDWHAGTTLTSGPLPISAPSPRSDCGPDAARIAAVLARGKRVALETAGPIDDLARAVWAILPDRTRRRASVATWTFSNGNRFDLLATPRLAGLDLDASYHEPPTGDEPAKAAGRLPFRLGFAAAAVLTLAGSVFLALRTGPAPAPDVPRPSHPAVPAPPATITPSRGPDPSVYRDGPPDRDEVRAVARGLIEFAHRFGVPIDESDNPTAMMVQIADRLRYVGPLLTETELRSLTSDPSPGRTRALAWDASIRRFATGRPLPGDFSNGPFRWRLDTLAWSFGLELDPTLSAPEVPSAIADALAIDESVRPNPLASKYPALAEYAKFLERLPRR